MSLKVFHILFIVASVLLTAFVGGWGIHQYLAFGSRGGLAVAATFIASGLALVIYGVRFFRKLLELR